MTEIFKCRKIGTKCCAPKSIIREALGEKENEETSPENIVHGSIARPLNSTPAHNTITEYPSSISKYNELFTIVLH